MRFELLQCGTDGVAACADGSGGVVVGPSSGAQAP